MKITQLFTGTLFLLGLFVSTQLKAAPLEHNGSIQGRVIDAASQQALPGATVRILGSERGATVNPLGLFTIGKLPAGNWQVETSFFGYATDTSSVLVKEDESAYLEIGLAYAEVELRSVQIRSDAWADPGRLALIDSRLRPANSGQDLLQSVPGLFIAQHGGGGKAEQIFLRGFDLDHGTDIALDVDGVPVNMVSHAHGQGYADLHYLIPETVEGVNVAKGPYQSQYGNLATAGAVSFRTRQSIDRSSLKLEGGSFGRFRGLALLDLSGSKAEAQGRSGYVAGEFMQTRGFFELPQDLQRLNVFGKYNLPLGARTTLSLSAHTFASSWDQSGQIPERAVASGQITPFGAIDSTEGGSTSRSGVNAQFNTALPSGGIVQQQVFASKYDFDLTSNFTFFAEDSVNGDAIRQRESRVLYGYAASHLEEVSVFGLSLRHRAGLSLRMDRVSDLRLDRVLQREEVLEEMMQGEVTELNAAVYIEESLDLTDRFTVTGGLRYDRFQFRYEDALSGDYRPERAQQGILSPKVRLDLELTERVRVYLHGGSGFHSNDARVVVRREVARTLPRALGADLGLVAKPFDRVVLQAAVWGLDMEQEFVYVGDAGIVEPSGKSRRLGLDLSLRYQVSDWIFVDGDLNLSRPRAVGEEDAFIPLAPTFTSAGGLSFRAPIGLSGSLRYRYLAPRPANEDYSLSAEGYGLVDAHLVYDLAERSSLGISCTNIFNQAWKEAQFETESRLQGEAEAVSEVHFTPGSPRALNIQLTFFL